MVGRALVLFVVVLFFYENDTFPTKKYEKSGSHWKKITSNGCTEGWECTPVVDCYKIIKLIDQIAFPCSIDGEALKICCPSSEVTTLATTTVVIKDSTINNYTTIWSKFPETLQANAKLLPTECGVNLDEKIFNGKTADLGQFPWMALIGHDVQEFSCVSKFWCSGTVINERYILTAAHCINMNPCSNKTIQPNIVRLGEWNVTSDEDCTFYAKNIKECAPPVVDLNIEEIIIHEKYGRRDIPSFRNDIALIRLAKDIEFNEFVSPICLHPEVSKNTNHLLVAGWGISTPTTGVLSPVLQFAEILLYDFRECNTITPPEAKPLAKTQFCAIGNKDENSCRGDSGGPVKYVSPLDGKYYQKGIVSIATTLECGEEGKPTIYTEVSTFIEWILETIR